MSRECRECFPRHRLQRKPLVSVPDMHHGTCVTHVPWCMSGLLTRGGGENVRGIPGAWATRNFTYLIRGSWGCLGTYSEIMISFQAWFPEHSGAFFFLLVVTMTSYTASGIVHGYCIYPRPVWAFGYCRCLRLSVCVCLFGFPCVCVRLFVRPSVCLSVRPCLCQPRACARSRTTKFGQKIQNTLVKVPIDFKSKFAPFWACPRDN